MHHLDAPFSHGQSKEPSVHPVLHRHIYAVYPFTLAFVQSVCITAEESRSVKIFYALFLFFENSRQSLFIIPLDILSFHPVHSRLFGILLRFLDCDDGIDKFS